MKKVMLSCALLVSAVVASAIPWSADAHRHSASLIKAGKLTEARAYLDTIDEATQCSTVGQRTWADYLDPAIDTSTSAKLASVAQVRYEAFGYAGIGLKNATEDIVLWVYVVNKEYDKALAHYNTLENPSAKCVAEAVYALQKLGRADEAIALAVANKQWYTAFNAANAKGDKVKTFEYGSKLLLDAPQKAPIVQKVLDAIGGINFRDTTVTDEMKIVFYKDVDKQYRRFMATDPTTWKPILAGALFSLKSLGVEVVE